MYITFREEENIFNEYLRKFNVSLCLSIKTFQLLKSKQEKFIDFFPSFKRSKVQIKLLIVDKIIF